MRVELVAARPAPLEARHEQVDQPLGLAQLGRRHPVELAVAQDLALGVRVGRDDDALDRRLVVGTSSVGDGIGIPPSSVWPGRRSSPGGARPSSVALDIVALVGRERGRLELAGMSPAALAPPAVEHRVVDRPVVAPPDEDRRAGGPDLLAVADVDEGQAAGEVDRRAEVDRGRPPAAPARTRPPRRAAGGRRPRHPTAPGRSAGSCMARPRCGSAPRGGLGQVLRGRVAADLADVLLVLEDDAERLVDELRRQLAGAERRAAQRPSRASRRCPAPWSGRPRAGDGRSRRPRGRAARAPRARGPGRSRIPSGRVG